MNLLLTLDENYLLPCKVMLDSFFASNPREKDVTVYLLHSAIPGGKLAELEAFCAEHPPEVAVLCLPRSGAEEISGRLVALGIQGFWNFSHYDLSVSYPDVVVENVHLGDSLMSLGYRLRNQD